MLNIDLDRDGKSPEDQSSPYDTPDAFRRPSRRAKSLADVLQDDEHSLLTTSEKVAGKKHDPIVEQLYFSRCFKFLLWSTIFLLSGWLLVILGFTAYSEERFMVLEFSVHYGLRGPVAFYVASILCSKQLA